MREKTPPPESSESAVISSNALRLKSSANTWGVLGASPLADASSSCMLAAIFSNSSSKSAAAAAWKHEKKGKHDSHLRRAACVCVSVCVRECVCACVRAHGRDKFRPNNGTSAELRAGAWVRERALLGAMGAARGPQQTCSARKEGEF